MGALVAVLGSLGGRLRSPEVIQKAFLQYPLAFFLVFMKKCYTVVTFKVKYSKSAIRYAKINATTGRADRNNSEITQHR